MANRKLTTAGSPGDDSFDPDGRVRRRLQKLLLEATRLWRCLNRDEERADALVREVREQLEALAPRPAKAAAGRAPRSASTAEQVRRCKALARQGVRDLKTEKRTDGFYDVCVDHGAELELPPALGALLAALAVENHRGTERLVGWKTKVELAELLEKFTGRVFSPPAITQLIYRLRIELFQRGDVNPFLIQTSPRLGARFALRREGQWM